MKLSHLIIIFCVSIFAGCADNFELPADLKTAIRHFYTENEFQNVIDIIVENDFFQHDEHANLISRMVFAGALCEDRKRDSAQKVLSTINMEKLNEKELFWYNSMYGLLLFRNDSLPKSYATLNATLKTPDVPEEARGLNKRILARIALTLGDYKKGTEWLIESSEFFKKADLPKSVAVNTKILGRYFMNTGNKTEALRCFLEAERAFVLANDSAELFYIYVNLLDYYLDENQTDEAEKYAIKSMKYSHYSSDYQMITLVYNNLGEIELQRENLEKAKKYFLKSLSFGTNYNSWVTRRLNSFTKLAEVSYKQNLTDEAKMYADSALNMLPETGYFRLKSRVYRQLAQVYHHSPLLETYLTQAYNSLDSSYNSISKSTQAFYEAKAEQINAENELNNMIESETEKRIILITALAIVLMISIFVYYHQRYRARLLKTLVNKNLKIIEEERKLNDLLRQKMVEKRSVRKNPANGITDKVFDDFILWLETNKNFTRNDVNLEMAAREINTNREYLSQSISNRGTRFTDLINKYRIEEVIRIFSTSSDKRNQYGLNYIATEVGFNSNSVFIEAFRRQTGMTPTQFRKSLLDTK